MRDWTCICGSTKFTLTRLGSFTVDFGEEGGVKGCPLITDNQVGKSGLICVGCHTAVADDVADEMIKEIV